MATQEAAQSVPDLIRARSIGFGLVIVGSETSGYRLLRSPRDRPVPLKGSTMDEAAACAVKALVAARSEDDLFAKPTTPVPVPRAGCVYFIGGDVGGIKIGFATSPKQRLRALQCGSPIELRILAVAPGMPADERDYHKRFADRRLSGEWFERCPEIEAEIERLNA